MKKHECEAAIRHLCHEWRKGAGLLDTPMEQLSFLAFLRWLKVEYPRYLTFRSSTSPQEDAERWFDDEFRQSWRR